jgi:glutamate synthase (NADPH/NADH) small chain
MATRPAIPPQRLELRLPDAKPTYAPGEAVAEAHRCLYCHDAPCVTACPTGIDIPGFIRKIGTGNVHGSARTILSANLLGYSCARVCPVEVLCVGACVYNEWHRTPPIQIGRLQRYAVETALTKDGGAALFTRAPKTGKRVACVGAGPASLAAAGYLALEGVEVTLYEKRRLAGGLNTTGVAPYKMHVEGSLLEVDFIRSLGVTLKSGVEVGKGVTPADLLRDHDAVFLGIGLGADSSLGLPNESGPGVAGATSWIEGMKLDPKSSLEGIRQAVVIGGGNTAIDAVRELARLGVPDVSLAYRRTAAEMPGYRHELDLALREGVRLIEKAIPKAFLRDSAGRLTALQLQNGQELPADLVVIAIGQARLRELAGAFPGVQVDAKGLVVADPASGQTGNPKVYVGGDALSGGELVVTAAQEGKRAARAIARALGLKIRVDAPLHAGHP